MRHKGATLRQIAERTGVAHGTIGRICKERGWTPRTPTKGDFCWTEKRTALLREMVMHRRSWKYMAARLGCTMSQLKYMMQKLDLVRERTRREAQAALDKALVSVPSAPRSGQDRRQPTTSGEMTRRLIRMLDGKGWPPVDIARQARCEVEEVKAVLA